MLDACDVHRDDGVGQRSVFRLDGEDDLGGRFIRVCGADAEAGGVPVIGDSGADRVAVPHGSVEREAAGHVFDGGGVGVAALQIDIVGARGNGDGSGGLASRNDNDVTVGERDGHIGLGGAVEADGEGHVADVVFRAAFAHGEADMELFRGFAGLAGPAFFAVDGLAVLPRHVEAAKAIEAAEEIHAGPFLIVRVVGGFRPGGGHEFGLAESGEEVPARDVRVAHLEHGHILRAVGGIELAQRDAGAVFQREDQIVAGARDFSLIRRKAEDETGTGSTFDRIGSFRLLQKDGIHTVLLRGVSWWPDSLYTQKAPNRVRPGL